MDPLLYVFMFIRIFGVQHMLTLIWFSILCYYSRYTWIHLIKHRSNIRNIYDAFTFVIHTRFQARVKVLRSDCAREYLYSTMHQILSSHDTCFSRRLVLKLISNTVLPSTNIVIFLTLPSPGFLFCSRQVLGRRQLLQLFM